MIFSVDSSYLGFAMHILSMSLVFSADYLPTILYLYLFVEISRLFVFTGSLFLVEFAEMDLRIFYAFPSEVA